MLSISAQSASYAFSISQVRSDFDEGNCDVYINAKQYTRANITDSTGTDAVTINANDTLKRTYSPGDRVTFNIEDKGILVDADQERIGSCGVG